jgi:putative membrane protein
VTLFLGVGLVHMMGYSFHTPPLWLSLKLGFVGLLVIYHVYCGILLKKFALGHNQHSSLFYRIFNEITVLILIAIVLLVVIKPT